jgi:hypothetical protein
MHKSLLICPLMLALIWDDGDMALLIRFSAARTAAALGFSALLLIPAFAIAGSC